MVDPDEASRADGLARLKCALLYAGADARQAGYDDVALLIELACAAIDDRSAGNFQG